MKIKILSKFVGFLFKKKNVIIHVDRYILLIYTAQWNWIIVEGTAKRYWVAKT